MARGSNMRAQTGSKYEQLFFIQLHLCYTIKITKDPDDSKLKGLGKERNKYIEENNDILFLETICNYTCNNVHIGFIFAKY